MKKIVLALVAVASLIACKEDVNPDANVHITGDVKGLSQGKLYLQKIQDSTLVMLDSIEISGNSKFESHITLESPEMLYLFLDRGVTNSIDNNLPFFAEPGSMTIQTSLDYFTADATIKGSKNQDLYNEYRLMMSRLINKNLDLIQARLIAINEKNTARIDSIQKEQDDNLRRRYLTTTNFVVNHGDYEIAPYITLAEIPDVTLKYLDTIDKSISPKIAKTKYGKKLKAFVAERKKMGQ